MMRSFDQYGNVMLEDTFERHVVGNVYADERVRALLSVLVLSVSGSAKGPANASDNCLAVAACCLNVSGRMQYFSRLGHQNLPDRIVRTDAWTPKSTGGIVCDPRREPGLAGGSGHGQGGTGVFFAFSDAVVSQSKPQSDSSPL